MPMLMALTAGVCSSNSSSFLLKGHFMILSTPNYLICGSTPSEKNQAGPHVACRLVPSWQHVLMMRPLVSRSKGLRSCWSVMYPAASLTQEEMNQQERCW